MKKSELRELIREEILNEGPKGNIFSDINKLEGEYHKLAKQKLDIKHKVKEECENILKEIENFLSKKYKIIKTSQTNDMFNKDLRIEFKAESYFFEIWLRTWEKSNKVRIFIYSKDSILKTPDHIDVNNLTWNNFEKIIDKLIKKIKTLNPEKFRSEKLKKILEKQ